MKTGAKTIKGALTTEGNVVLGTPNQGDVFYCDGSNLVRLTPGTAGKYLKTQGAAANPMWDTPAGSSGVVIQQVRVQNNTMAAITTIIPYDDTIPQITEGTEIMTLAITPTSATNILRIQVTAYLNQNTYIYWTPVCLFQDTTANALAVGNAYNGYVGGVHLDYYMVAGTIIATTFRVRTGSLGTGTTFNGDGGVRYMGGALYSSIIITELTV